ncbi:hypothetical protein KI743_18310 [Vibrio sp. D420a]|uniref:hypothetical protein n=1 Tax=Vibrio sp. D420a TaxID=2836895 RepID=UPI0025521723|nr:hypothetical protein [Vibrio sp. D420a]MDK9763963.1 hypothetical protein [Vibrio sp. D420a]
MAAQQLSSVNVDLNVSSAQYIEQLKAAQRETKRRLGDIQKDYNRFTTAVNPAVASATAFAAVVTSAANESYQAAIEMERLSESAGLSQRAFKEMSVATARVGVDMDQLGSILGDTEEKIGDFIATGGGGFQDFADVMGLTEAQAQATAEELQNLSGRDVLIEMVRQMENAGASAEEMNFALEGMGSDARYLLPLLRDNAAELNRLENRFGSLATTLDEKTVFQLGELNTVSTLVAENMRNALATALASVSERLIKAGENAAFFWASMQAGTQQQVLSDMARLNDQIKTTESELQELRDGGAWYDTVLTPDSVIDGQIKTREKLLNQYKTEYKQLQENYKLLTGLVLPTAPTQSTGSGGSETPAEVATVGTGQADHDAQYQTYVDYQNAITQAYTDAENYRQQTDIIYAESYEERLRLQADYEIKHLDQSLINTEAYQAQKKAIEDRYRLEKERLDKLSAEKELQNAAGNVDAIGEAFGLQFNFKKNLELSKALINAPAAISEAVASAPFPYNIPAISFATLETAATIAEIRAVNMPQFEQGSEYIPRDMPAMVHEGERVVQKDINRDLQNFLDSEKGGGSSGGINIQAPLTIQGGSIDDEVLSVIAKYPKQIALAVQRGQGYRPTRK